MAKAVYFALCLLIVKIQTIASQCINQLPPSQPSFNFEGQRQFDINPNFSPIPYYNGPFIDTPRKQTTVISDCTPEVCKNLVNTIQLLIVSNLLKNTRKCPSDAAVKLASPVINEVLASVQNNPGLSSDCGLLGGGVNPGPLLGPIQNDNALFNGNGLLSSNFNPGLLNSIVLGGNNFNPGFTGGSGYGNANPRIISNNVLSGSSCPCSNNFGNQGLSPNLINLLNNLDSL